MQRKDDEVRCWGFHISDSGWMNNTEIIKSMHGLLGLHISAVYGIGLIFETENDAKVARNIWEYERFSVSKIQEVFVPEKEYQRAIENRRKAK